MQQVVQFMVDTEDDKKLKEAAEKLGLKRSDFLRLVVKLYLSDIGLERRELAIEADELNSLAGTTFLEPVSRG
jgi:hypothetical protein